MSNPKPPLSPALAVCLRCGRQYVDRQGLSGNCPQCNETRAPLAEARTASPRLLLWSIRENTAYRGARSVLAILTVIGLIGGVGLIGFAIAGQRQPDVMIIGVGVVTLLTAALQNLLGNAFLDIADASIRQAGRNG